MTCIFMPICPFPHY